MALAGWRYVTMRNARARRAATRSCLRRVLHAWQIWLSDGIHQEAGSRRANRWRSRRLLTAGLAGLQAAVDSAAAATGQLASNMLRRVLQVCPNMQVSGWLMVHTHDRSPNLMLLS
jgi:hypothetical protein